MVQYLGDKNSAGYSVSRVLVRGKGLTQSKQERGMGEGEGEGGMEGEEERRRHTQGHPEEAFHWGRGGHEWVWC